MTGHDLDGYSIRRLWPLDFSAFLRHLKRLDGETRRSRFGSPVNDDFLETYAATANRLGTLVYGAAEPRTGAVISTVRGVELPGHNHRFEVVCGVREAECRELIQIFFRERRGTAGHDAERTPGS